MNPAIRTLAIAPIVLSLLLLPAFAGSAASQRRPDGAALAEFSRSLQELSERVSPSIVQIFVTAYAVPDEEDQSKTGEPIIERSSGSGVIVDGDGYIVTNAHVVENATRVEVELPVTAGPQGGSILKRRGRIVGAQIVAIDAETDVAVIRVEARNLPALPFGDSDSLRPGQIVLAFGSPLGLQTSVTMGVVSAVARQLTPEDPMIYVQTDAPINPGNSGGALVDTDGRLVGINTLIYSQSGGNEGIGFAAPSNIVRNVFTQIHKTGRVTPRRNRRLRPDHHTPDGGGARRDRRRGSDPVRRRSGKSRRKGGPSARRPHPGPRREANRERASVQDQSLHAWCRRHGGHRGAARHVAVHRAGRRSRARERCRPPERDGCAA